MSEQPDKTDEAKGKVHFKGPGEWRRKAVAAQKASPDYQDEDSAEEKLKGSEGDDAG
jgi:hypothetical protein